MKSGITVVGTGSASGPPDRAQLTLAASAVRSDPGAAMTVTSERAQALRERLGELGIEPENIQTADLSLWPETDRNGAPAGYRARNGIRVEFNDLGNVGSVIASALEALGDGAEMGGIAFLRRDRAELEQEARAAAWAAAREKATELAQLAGVTLGRPLSVEELGGGGGGTSQDGPNADGSRQRSGRGRVQPGQRDPGCAFRPGRLTVPRTSGVLAHVTSLPGPHGIGTLGEPAQRFATALAEGGQRFWQMLPVGPTGYRDSPYQSPSTFAGNPLLIDLDLLVEDGLLKAREVEPLLGLPRGQVEFGRLIELKTPLLQLAGRRFLRAGSDSAFDEFRQVGWLDDFALFSALKKSRNLAPWVDWEPDIVSRESKALTRAARKLSGAIEVERAIQFFFDRQWRQLIRHCSGLGVGLIGDLPIFVAHDSADVWSRPDLFWVGADGQPSVVAGVPPDYFSKTGQRWGNPLYRWEVHKDEGYRWWKDRLRASLSRFDLIRIDHFRGFCAYWEVPASEETAVNGRWVDGPGSDLFEEVAGSERLPIIAEDLGVITPDVTALRQRFGFPGMRVAQFGFDDEVDTALHNPENYPLDVFAYTGTHDNDTTVGWFWGSNQRHDRRRLSANRKRLLQTLGSTGSDISWELARLVFESKADTAILPVQDLLTLGAEARMNTPGQETGNWTWRMSGPLSPETMDRLARLTEASRRK